MIRKSKNEALNLQFGAEIVELKASKTSQYKDRDGRIFKFGADVSTIPNLATLLARAIELGASTNEREAARKSTNTTNFRFLNIFAAWLDEQDSPSLSEATLREFRDHLFSKKNAGHAYGIYTVVAKSMKLLIEDGAIGKFSIPENASRSAVIASSAKTGATLATAVNGNAWHGASVDDINETMMKAWLSAAWLEIDRLCTRIEQAKLWRDEARINWTPPEWLSPARHAPADREILVKTAIQIIAKKFGPVVPPSFLQNISDTPDDPHSLMLSKIRARAQRMGEPIFPYEIVSHFFPTAPLAGLALSVLCCSQVNPDSAARLKISDLVDDQEPDRKRLHWHKGRAGGPQTAMPFPIGSPNAKTIPRLWERLLLASSELRKQAPSDARPYLFLWAASDPSPNPVRLFGPDKPVASAWEPAKRYLLGQLRKLPAGAQSLEAIEPLKHTLSQLNLALLRSTAINISSARLNRDFSAVAKMDGRRTVEVLDTHYLNNAQTREHLDADIRKAQSFLQGWVQSKPIILPPDALKVSEATGVDQDEAKSIIDDDLNLGNGASFLNDQAIFIDTPINALRVIQWLNHLKEAEPRMLRDNPGRWARLFEPQTRLFQEALHAFSRPSVAAARALDQEIDLPFPPIY